jgi:membrane-bound lytic murein transglycosylase A
MDRRIYPYGLMVWVDTTVTPPGEITRPYQRAMVIQDTGGAIRGPIRGDLFLGRGSKAAALAGAWQSRGAVYVFVPKTVIKPAPSSRFHAKSL